MKKVIIAAFFLSFVFSVFSQQPVKDKAVFKTYKEGYFEKYILTGIEEFESKDKPAPARRSFKVDMSSMDIPKSKDEFKSFWHNDPISQGNTNTCWCFSTTSFLESEVYRITGKKVKLSEMFTVYNEYLERTKLYIETRGTSAFAEGSEGNAVTREWKKYGIVRYEDYSGLLPGQTYYNHEKMFNEMTSFLKNLKETNNWNEEFALSTIKSIMHHYMGVPPTTIKVDGKDLTPVQYLNDVLKINPDDFIDVLSYMQAPYWKKAEYEVPDNWWHSKEYYNIPLEDYMSVIKKAIRNGYTVAIGGDVSEAGFDAKDYQTAIVPTFDIPSAYIDENARQFRFSNGSTTDDHGMHIVGFEEKNGVTWFLVKDSGAGSRTGGKEKNRNFGYYFFHEDFVKLKMMDCMVHKDMMKEYLPKFK